LKSNKTRKYTVVAGKSRHKKPDSEQTCNEMSMMSI